MSRRKYGSLEAHSPTELPSDQVGMSTSELSRSMSEPVSNSKMSAQGEDSTQNTPATNPQIVIVFSPEGVRIQISDDMHRVPPAVLERGYYQAMRECQIQRTRVVHNMKEEKDAA